MGSKWSFLHEPDIHLFSLQCPTQYTLQQSCCCWLISVAHEATGFQIQSHPHTFIHSRIEEFLAEAAKKEEEQKFYVEQRLRHKMLWLGLKFKKCMRFVGRALRGKQIQCTLSSCYWIISLFLVFFRLIRFNEILFRFWFKLNPFHSILPAEHFVARLAISHVNVKLN